MNDLINQLFTLWRKFKLQHKIFLISTVGIAIAAIFILTISKRRGVIIPVANSETTLPGEVKGFELFDSNTWIKGEKELQVLEMRALKGQLEKDLAKFDQIKSANVILDIPPTRAFSSVPQKTKASVILTLMPDANLATSQLKAIVFHLMGAVRGLDHHMIALSDTTGKLYKAIDPQSEEPLKYLFFENALKEKIDMLLTKIVGSDHFFSCVKVAPDHSKASIVISVNDAIKERDELLRQVKAITHASEMETDPIIDFLPFAQTQVKWAEKKEIKKSKSFFGLFALLIIIPFLFYIVKRLKPKQSTLSDSMLRVDFNKLFEEIKNEDPKKIASMVSYLEPARAEKIITAFPSNIQEKILFHLSELEKEI